MNKLIFLLSFLLTGLLPVTAQIKIGNNAGSGRYFAIYAHGKTCPVYIDDKDYIVVKKLPDFLPKIWKELPEQRGK